MPNLSGTVAGTADLEYETSSAQAWFAGGERAGYDPQARAMVTTGGAPLKVFLRREGDPTQAVSFLPGFPDGSFGWAKVRQYLPNAAEMPKLFIDYVGMGDSDKPKDYAYSTAERTDLVEAIWRDLSVQSTTLVAFDFSSLVVRLARRRRSCDRRRHGVCELGLRAQWRHRGQRAAGVRAGGGPAAVRTDKAGTVVGRPGKKPQVQFGRFIDLVTPIAPPFATTGE